MPLLKTENRFFIFIVGLAGVSVAGWAAVFSVTGLAMVYSGPFIAFAMGVLEFSKLIIASYLYRHWNETKLWLKSYMTIALVTLMIITSGGIYGYLTSAYQGATIGLDKLNSQSQVLEQTKERFYNERDRIVGDLERIRQERQETIQSRNAEINQMSIADSTRYYDRLQRQRVYNRYNEEIQRVDGSIAKLNTNLDSTNVRISRVEQGLSDKKLEMIDTGADVGPLLYMARIFNTDMDTVMKWFTLIIVMVFDPLAIALVLALNVILVNKSNEPEPEIRGYQSDDRNKLEDPPGYNDLVKKEDVEDDEDESFDLGEPDDLSFRYEDGVDDLLLNAHPFVTESKDTDSFSDKDVSTHNLFTKPGNIYPPKTDERPRFSTPNPKENYGTQVMKKVVDDFKKMSKEEYEDLHEEAKQYEPINIVTPFEFSPRPDIDEEEQASLPITNLDEEFEEDIIESVDNFIEERSSYHEKSDPEEEYNEKIKPRNPLTADEIKNMVEEAARDARREGVGEISNVVFEPGGRVTVDHSIQEDPIQEDKE